LPINAREFFAAGDDQTPNLIENTRTLPTLQSSMHARIITEFFGQVVPLAAGSHSVDNAIERVADIDAMSTHRLGWIIAVKHILYQFPEIVWNFPDRRQTLCRGVSFAHCRNLLQKRLKQSQEGFQ
jgi:hypothetical protein